jgi:5-methylcytosine-specific restriction endonuclease McrA
MDGYPGVESTIRTAFVGRGGRRTRISRGIRCDRPGVQLRRNMRRLGLRWCRRCRDWLPFEQVTKKGLCRPHENEVYRERYRAGARLAITQRVHARKRGVAPVPRIGQEYLLEQFEHRCAYCAAPATTWDHVVPVSNGGQTRPGNIVPACRSCNSSKGARNVAEWLRARGRVPNDSFFDVIILAEAGLY